MLGLPAPLFRLPCWASKARSPRIFRARAKSHKGLGPNLDMKHGAGNLPEKLFCWVGRKGLAACRCWGCWHGLARLTGLPLPFQSDELLVCRLFFVVLVAVDQNKLSSSFFDRVFVSNEVTCWNVKHLYQRVVFLLHFDKKVALQEQMSSPGPNKALTTFKFLESAW